MMEFHQHDYGVITIKGFYTPDECDALIKRSQSMAYEEAAIDTGSGQEIFKDIRNNDRIFFDDFDLAKTLYDRVKLFVPETAYDWKIFGLNERFRFYRYQPSQYFKWHRDGSFRRSWEEESKFTFMIYLNDDFKGGETEFHEFVIRPEKGMACIFPHPVMHQGASVTSGVKYILRTDIMFTRIM